MKVQDSVGYLRRPDGSVAQTNSEKVETLTAFFSAVFTREDTEELPDFDERQFAIPVETLHIPPYQIEKILGNLNISKSEGPDGLHPRILKEVCAEISDPKQRFARNRFRKVEYHKDGKMDI